MTSAVADLDKGSSLCSVRTICAVPSYLGLNNESLVASTRGCRWLTEAFLDLWLSTRPLRSRRLGLARMRDARLYSGESCRYSCQRRRDQDGGVDGLGPHSPAFIRLAAVQMRIATTARLTARGLALAVALAPRAIPACAGGASAAICSCFRFLGRPRRRPRRRGLSSPRSWRRRLLLGVPSRDCRWGPAPSRFPRRRSRL